MSKHVRSLVVGTLCGVVLLGAGCSSGPRVSTGTSPRPSSTPTPAAATQAGTYCKDLQAGLEPQGNFAQMPPSQARAFFARLDGELAKAVSEAPPSLRSVTQTLADTYRHLGQEVAAHGYNPSYHPPDAQMLGPAVFGFLNTATPWLKAHCPGVLRGGLGPSAGGLSGAPPSSGSSGATGQAGAESASSPAASSALAGPAPADAPWRVQLTATGEVLTGIACASTTSCTAVGHVQAASGGGGGATRYTTDGGASWAAGSMPARDVELSRAVVCLGLETCFADGGGVGANSGAAGIDASANGGASWASQALLSGVASLVGLACTSVSACFATGAAQGGQALMLSTTNGGTSWEARQIPDVASLGAISCVYPSSCYTLAKRSPSAGAPPAPVVLVTSGTTGTGSVIPVPPAQGSSGSAPADLTAISCPAPGVCFIAGFNDSLGMVLVTTGGGASWAAVGHGSGIPGSRPQGVSCTSPKDCSVTAEDAATGAAEVFTTTDGGASWVQPAVPATVATLGAVSCATSQPSFPAPAACWAVGQDGDGASVIVSDAL